MFWTFYILLQRRNIILAFLLFLLCSFSFSLIFSSSTTFALHFISFPFPSSSCYFVVQISFYYSSPSFPLVSFSSTFFSASPFSSFDVSVLFCSSSFSSSAYVSSSCSSWGFSCFCFVFFCLFCFCL